MSHYYIVIIIIITIVVVEVGGFRCYYAILHNPRRCLAAYAASGKNRNISKYITNAHPCEPTNNDACTSYIDSSQVSLFALWHSNS